MDGALDTAVQADPLRRSLEFWLALVGAPLLLALAVAVYAYFPRTFSMSAGSMVPTLLVGDIVAASKLSGPPQRGDVVVFTVPSKSTPWVKRVIGLPGETVQMKEGRLYINGEMVARAPLAKVRAEDFYGNVTEVPTYLETLPGGSKHTIVEIQGDTGFNDNTVLFTLPKDAFFVMGDNRDNSTDSRVSVEEGGIAFVAAKDISRRASFILYSKTHGDRVLMPIH